RAGSSGPRKPWEFSTHWYFPCSSHPETTRPGISVKPRSGSKGCPSKYSGGPKRRRARTSKASSAATTERHRIAAFVRGRLLAERSTFPGRWSAPVTSPPPTSAPSLLLAAAQILRPAGLDHERSVGQQGAVLGEQLAQVPVVAQPVPGLVDLGVAGPPAAG